MRKYLHHGEPSLWTIPFSPSCSPRSSGIPRKPRACAGPQPHGGGRRASSVQFFASASSGRLIIFEWSRLVC